MRLACEAAPRIQLYGICELPWTTLVKICRALDADVRAVEFQYLGVNHHAVFTRISVGSRDLLDEYQRWAGRDGPFPTPDQIRCCRGFPTKYVRLHLEREKVLLEQSARRSKRGDFLQGYRDRALTVFDTGNVDRISDVLDVRPAPWYPDAIVPLLLSLSDGRGSVPLFLSRRNEGLETWFRDDDVLEIPHVSRAGVLLPLENNERPPAETLDIVRPIVEFERAAAEAVLSSDDSLLVTALQVHPWVRDRHVAGGLARAIAHDGIRSHSPFDHRFGN